MSGRRALVLGGAGFIGSHLIASLVESGQYDAIVSADIQPPRFVIDGAHYKHVDVTRPLPADICPGVDEIYNLAAIHTTPGHADWEYFWTNVRGATHCCDYARRTGCNLIVFTSSISVYGPSEEPRDEDSALEPDTAYGRSKLCAEEIHAQWADEAPEARRLVVARPAAIYGYGERGNFTRLAKMIKNDRFVFPGRKDTVKACGYVEDLVRSFRFALDRNQPRLTYNFAHGERLTAETICNALAEVAGYSKAGRVMPLPLMLAGGVLFEALNAFGLRTPINRARIRKLATSTNVLPARLARMEFQYRYDLKQSLRHWLDMSGGVEFR